MAFLTADDLNPLARRGARAILKAFDSYQTEFMRITLRAKTSFENRDWHGTQKDALTRLELYKKVIQLIVANIEETLGEQTHNALIWSKMKAEYSQLIPGRQDMVLAETFFNSVTRRIFTTVGVDPNIEFVASDFEASEEWTGPSIYHTYHPEASLAVLVQNILADYPFRVGYQDLEREALFLAEEIASHLEEKTGSPALTRIEMLQPVFFRGNGAYLVGRIIQSGDTGSEQPCMTPLALCLLNKSGGVVVDAVLMDEDEVSIVFSFTRSYFHVAVERPHELVTFLKSIMPLKRIAELYISIGYNKHGKTELYRDLLHKLENSTDRFEIARGEKGMVMIVFTLPSYDLVFKVIKDKVDPPKTATRQEVMERYDLVFKHDRAGRLVDAQEFEYLSFERARFSESLLAELQTLAPRMLTMDDECVVIKHLYIERRLIPLNLFVQEADEATARETVIDYGKAIKDLAATNIFPGDILLKNFGVTRHGRVVFYDYDELCLLTDVKFRKVPQARNFYDEYEAEPWFYVGPQDIFPEEFRTFLGLQGPLRSEFIAAHEDLFGVSFWKDMQSRHKNGDVVEIFPYPDQRRLNRPLSE